MRIRSSQWHSLPRSTALSSRLHVAMLLDNGVALLWLLMLCLPVTLSASTNVNLSPQQLLVRAAEGPLQAGLISLVDPSPLDAQTALPWPAGCRLRGAGPGLSRVDARSLAHAADAPVFSVTGRCTWQQQHL